LERQLSEGAGFVEPSVRGWSIAADTEWQDAFWCFASDAAARFTDVITRVTARPDNVGEDSWVDVKPGVRVRARALARKPISPVNVSGSRGFEAGSLYVMRHQDFQLTMVAGGGSDRGDSHQDALSITLSAYGRTFLVDPGTYLRDPGSYDAARLREAGSHNVLSLVGDDKMHHRQAADLKSDSHPTVHRWVSEAKYDFLDASQTWQGKQASPVIHRRQIWFDKATRLWVLHDQVRLADPKDMPALDLEIWLQFHFASGPLHIDRPNDAFYTGGMAGPNLILLPLGDFKLVPSVEEGLVSPRYGVQIAGPVARYSGKVKLPCDLIIMLYPNKGEMDFKVVRAAGRTALLNFKKALTSLSGADAQTRTAGPLAAQRS
jgi:Heparinase II/III-like protein